MGPKNKGSITRRADFGRTPISDIFRGQLRSRVQRAGDQSTDNVQPFFTLQLDIEVNWMNLLIGAPEFLSKDIVYIKIINHSLKGHYHFFKKKSSLCFM